MQMTEEAKKALPELVKAIYDVLRKYSPETKINTAEVEGLIIMQFPKEHGHSGLVHSTFLGHICTEHALQCVFDTCRSRKEESNPLAT